MSIARLESTIAALDVVTEEDYPALRDSIVGQGEAGFARGIALAGYDPLTIERDTLRACLVNVLQIAYACAWLAQNA